MKLFVVLLVAAVASLLQTAESASCDSDLIDGDMYRVSDQLFFTDRDTSEPAYKLREGSGDSWCTVEDLPVHDSPWIEVRFGVDVEIRALSTAGWHGFTYDEYVRSYQVQYARLGQQQLQYITDQGSTSVKTFGRQDNPDLQRVELPTPIVAERLRIIVVPGSWTRDRACMRAEAHGCPVHTTCSSSIRLSNDRTLLPLASITASSQNNDDPASDLVDTGDTAWCSEETIESGPHIILNFKQPVVLTHMIGRGGVGGLSYVTEFSIQSQIDGLFEQYQQPNGAIEFIAPDEEPTVFTFWRPLHVNTTIRFNVLEATYNSLPFFDNDFCFNVQLFGCLLSQANVSSSSISSTSVMPTQATSPSETNTINGLSLTSLILTSSIASSPTPMTPSYSQMNLLTSSSLPMDHSSLPMASSMASLPKASSPPVIRLSTGQTVGMSVGVLLAVLMIILLTMAGIVIWRLHSRRKQLASDDVYMTVGNDMLYGSELRYNDSKEKEMNSNGAAVQMTSCHDNLYEIIGDKEDKIELVENSESMVDNPMYGGGATTSEESRHRIADSEEDMTANPLYAGSNDQLATCGANAEEEPADMSTATSNPMYAGCSTADENDTSNDSHAAENPLYGQTDQKIINN